ncbi:DUF2231 domain-containing protein [Mariniluteicoccus endophyticus]
MRRRTSPFTPLLLKLEDARVLDRGVDAARPLMSALTERPLVKDALQGRWLSHAVHPLLIEVPMGTWMSALALDATGVDEGGRSAELLQGIGIAAAVPAALTGWAELAEAGTREKRVGVVHAAANGAGVALQAASWLARRRGDRGRALALSAAAMGLVGAAGLLGGHLAVARHVGTRDPALDEPEAHPAW